MPTRHEYRKPYRISAPVTSEAWKSSVCLSIRTAAMSVGAGTTNAGTSRMRTQASQAARMISTSTMLGMAEPSA